MTSGGQEKGPRVIHRIGGLENSSGIVTRISSGYTPHRWLRKPTMVNISSVTMLYTA